MSDKRYIDEEAVAVAALKKQFPGNADVLAREKTLLEFMAYLERKLDALPKAHVKALFKAMVRDGTIDRCRRMQGAAFDREHAEWLAMMGVDVAQPPAPEK